MLHSKIGCGEEIGSTYLAFCKRRPLPLAHIILGLMAEMWTEIGTKMAFSTALFNILMCFSKDNLGYNCSFMW